MAKGRNTVFRTLTSPQTVEVISSVVKQNLCTGCGICAAICPTGSLMMRLNKNGEFVPVLGDGCNGCDLCSSVCPQLSKNNENISVQNIISNKSNDVFGYSDELTTWAGYAVDLTRRLQSSSGGLVTLVLQYLLDSRKIDTAIVVDCANPNNGLLFEAKLVRTVEELYRCAGSKYYPIELSKAIGELKSSKKRAAIVGLPCHVSAIRLLMEKSERFKNQIQYIFGLVCSHGVSTHFTDMLTAVTGASLGEVDSVSYRGKEGILAASDFTFSAFQNNQVIGKPIGFQSSLYGSAWCRHLFVPRACHFCTDCFAQNADATFMDAWLPEYTKDPRGTSLIVSRTAQMTEILQGLTKSRLANLWEVTPEDILRSQAGVIHYKRELLPDRVFSAISHGKAVPEHLKSFAVKGTRAQRKENNRHERYRQISSFLWRLNLPAWIRLKMIMYLIGPGIIQQSRSLLIRILGQRGRVFVKGILERIKVLGG